MTLAKFFSSLFRGLPQLLLAGILFTLPFTMVFKVFFLVGAVANLGSVFVCFLAVVPLFPFCTNMARIASRVMEKRRSISIFSGFVNKVGRGLLEFLVRNIIVCTTIFVDCCSVILCLKLNSGGKVFCIPLIVYVLVTVFFLFVFFCIPPVAIAFSVGVGSVCGGDTLVAFNRLGRGLFTIFKVLVLFLIYTAILVYDFAPMLLVVFAVILTLFVIPSVLSFVVGSTICGGVCSVVISGSSGDGAVSGGVRGEHGNRFHSSRRPITRSCSSLRVSRSTSNSRFVFCGKGVVGEDCLLGLGGRTRREGGTG